jgi:hypothetical protein
MLRDFLQVGEAAVVFAACGWWSLVLLAEHSLYLVGTPFALICVILFARRPLGLLVGILITGAWPLAWWCAVQLYGLTENSSYLSLGLGGLVGAVSVAVAVGIVHWRLLTFRCLVGAAAIGFLAGLAFVPYLNLYMSDKAPWPRNPVEDLLYRLGFAVWQTAVGAYIYAIVKMAPRSPAVKQA